MSALRMEKQLAQSSISLTKSTLASRESTTFEISSLVTGLVTMNGNKRDWQKEARLGPSVNSSSVYS